MQSKSTFPARIAPFSVLEPLPFSRVGLRKAKCPLLVHVFDYYCIGTHMFIFSDLQAKVISDNTEPWIMLVTTSISLLMYSSVLCHGHCHH